MYTHVAGPSSGKSTLMQEHLAAAQLQGMLIYYFEVEESGEGSYMLRQGVKPPAEYMLKDGSRGFYYLVPQTGEEVYRIAIGFLKQLPTLDRDTLIHRPPRVIFLVDGYESMTSEGVTVDKNPIGQYARMHSRFQKIVHNHLRRTGSAWVATNQTRTSGIGSFIVNPEADAGGQALKFYADVKTFLRRKRAGADNFPDGVAPLSIQTTKNRLCVPYQTIRERVYIGHGVDRLFDRLMFLVTVGKVKQDGKVFTIDGKKYNLDRARKLMREDTWWRLCRHLRRDPAVYDQYFIERMAKPDW
jgi:RecA/RadA recombinase